VSATTRGAGADAEPARTRAAGEFDFDIHGFVGIRLLDAAESDVLAMARRLGARPAPLEREPDLVFRFLRRLNSRSSARGGGITENGLLVAGRPRRGERRAVIPFDRLGSRPCEILCESGARAIPLLDPIVHITALANGLLPVHASAFSYRGTGALIAGWAHGGKTTLLLAFMADGAQYIGDDWVYLTNDGGRAYGLAEPIELAHRHVEHLTGFRTSLDWRGRVRLRSSKLARMAADLPSDGARRLSRTAEGRLATHVDPRRIFGDDACALEGRPTKVFLILPDEADAVTIEPVGADRLARSLAFASQHERLRFMAGYLQFRFLRPNAANDLLDRLDALELEGLMQALKNKDAYVVRVPPSERGRAVYDAIRPLF
jgi:hypothetical protein